MKTRSRLLIATSATLSLSLIASPIWAAGSSETDVTELTSISMAGQSVPVIKNGLYDRYRSNPPLSVISAESPDVDLSWFKQL